MLHRTSILLATLLALTTLTACSDDDDAITDPGGGGGGDEMHGWQWVGPLPQGNTLNATYAFDGRTAVAVGDHGTILRTSDGGDSWRVLDTPTTARLRDVDFGGSGRGLAVGDDGTILRSTDRGNSWTLIGSATTTRLTAVARTGADGAVVVGYSSTLLTTGDLGATWTPRSAGGATILHDVDFHDANTGVVAAGNEALWTIDGGATWTARSTGADLLRIALLTGTTAVGLSADYGSFEDNTGFLLTTDGGANWSRRTGSLDDEPADLQFVDALRGYAVSESGVARTRDGGLSWSELEVGDAEPRAVTEAGGNLILVGEFGELHRSDDAGATWSSLTPDAAFDVDHVAFGDAETGLMGGAGLWRTTDAGLTWEKVADHAVDRISFGSPTTAATAGGGIWNSLDAGLTWTQSLTNLIEYVHQGSINVGVSTTCTNGRAVRITRDGGASWSTIPEPVQYCVYEPFVLDDRNIVITGQNGQMYRSYSGGSSWTTVAAGSSERHIAVDFDPERTVGIAVGQNGSIVRTTDAGRTWAPVASGTNASLRDVAFADATTVYAVGGLGTVMKSTDAGLTWLQQEAPTSNFLLGIAFATPETAVIVGRGGTVLRTTTGGEW